MHSSATRGFCCAREPGTICCHLLAVVLARAQQERACNLSWGTHGSDAPMHSACCSGHRLPPPRGQPMSFLAFSGVGVGVRVGALIVAQGGVQHVARPSVTMAQRRGLLCDGAAPLNAGNPCMCLVLSVRHVRVRGLFLSQASADARLCAVALAAASSGVHLSALYLCLHCCCHASVCCHGHAAAVNCMPS